MLSVIHFFIMKITNKREIKHITSNRSSDIELKDFLKLHKNYSKEPFSFLLSDTILSTDNPLIFMKNVLQNDYQPDKCSRKTKLNMV